MRSLCCIAQVVAGEENNTSCIIQSDELRQVLRALHSERWVSLDDGKHFAIRAAPSGNHGVSVGRCQTNLSPPAVILGEVWAVLPDLGTALRLEALHHSILLCRGLGYELQQLLTPAIRWHCRIRNATTVSCMHLPDTSLLVYDVELHKQVPQHGLPIRQFLHAHQNFLKGCEAGRLACRRCAGAIAYFSVLRRSCKDGLFRRSSRSPPGRFCGRASPGGRCRGPPGNPGGPPIPGRPPGGPPCPGGPWKPGLMGMPIGPGMPGPDIPARGSWGSVSFYGCCCTHGWVFWPSHNPTWSDARSGPTQITAGCVHASHTPAKGAAAGNGRFLA